MRARRDCRSYRVDDDAEVDLSEDYPPQSQVDSFLRGEVKEEDLARYHGPTVGAVDV
jgi:hypothetical protein